MIKQLLMGIMSMCLLFSCSEAETGFIGEWEGKAERINTNGNLVEINISCTIKASDGVNRNVELSVAGVNYTFDAVEDLEDLVYKNKALNSDSTIISYISGSATILYDTILHFDYEVYALKNNALLYSDREVLDMVRK